jgi:hypothetical protein
MNRFKLRLDLLRQRKAWNRALGRLNVHDRELVRHMYKLPYKSVAIGGTGVALGSAVGVPPILPFMLSGAYWGYHEKDYGKAHDKFRKMYYNELSKLRKVS